MTTFDKREEGFEKKFAHDEELKFKAEARRNKLAGLWAAEKLGITGADAEAYAKTVVAADFEEPGVGDVVRKLRADFDAFLQSNSDALATAAINTLLQAFASVENDEQMMAFYQSVPGELEEPLIEAVEAIIEQATSAGDTNAVEHLSERLAPFKQLCERKILG